MKAEQEPFDADPYDEGRAIERVEPGFSSGDVTCRCGETLHLWWNGGELDDHECSCGRWYRTEHVSTALIVRTAPPPAR